MENFSEIFQVMIHDHGQRPRNFGPLEGATHQEEGVNPLTGDQLTVQFVIGEDGVISRAGFTGKASSLATTSASVMTGDLTGRPRTQALDRVEQTLAWFSGETELPKDLDDNEFSLLLEIRNFPHRIRCVSLAWKTAALALGTQSRPYLEK